MTDRNELEQIADKAVRRIRRLAVSARRSLMEWYNNEIAEGNAETPYKLREIPFDSSEWYDETKDVTISSMIAGTNVGLEGAYLLASVSGTSKYYDGLKVKGLTLSERLRDSASYAEKLTLQTLNTHIENKTTWKRLTDDLTRQRVSKGDLPKYLTELNDYALKAGGDTRELNRLIARATANINELAKNGAPTQRLKRAYSQVVNAVVAGDSKALNTAMKTALDRKAVYNNERIARTEIAKANNMAFNRRFRDHPLYDEGLIYIRHSLSSSHTIYDECNFYAEANTMGLGAGIFDEKHAPAIPIHPHCLCMQSIVAKNVEDKRKHRYSKERAEEWIDKQSEKKQDILRARLESNEMRRSKALPKDQVKPI